MVLHGVEQHVRPMPNAARIGTLDLAADQAALDDENLARLVPAGEQRHAGLHELHLVQERQHFALHLRHVLHHLHWQQRLLPPLQRAVGLEDRAQRHVVPRWRADVELHRRTQQRLLAVLKGGAEAVKHQARPARHGLLRRAAQDPRCGDAVRDQQVLYVEPARRDVRDDHVHALFVQALPQNAERLCGSGIQPRDLSKVKQQRLGGSCFSEAEFSLCRIHLYAGRGAVVRPVGCLQQICDHEHLL
mmetsp:Transcript_25307/g.63727  ORF Transcript_25307/g.63727 Transcript_25307/m.63727 type:complete len:246 (-) Transcript_25307:616-1353(-)